MEKPIIMDIEELKQTLKIKSDNTIRKMVKDGMPVIKYHNIKRFELKKVISWMERHARTKEAAKSA